MARFYCLDEKEYNYLLKMVDRAMAGTGEMRIEEIEKDLNIFETRWF
ncbi:MAG: hypothetical protein ACP5T9_03080 [Thermoplasmata archaeon]